MAEFVEDQEKENTEKALQNFALLNGRAKFHLPCLFTKFLLPTWPQRSNATIYGCCYIFIVINSISFNSRNYLLSTLETPATVGDQGSTHWIANYSCRLEAHCELMFMENC